MKQKNIISFVLTIIMIFTITPVIAVGETHEFPKNWLYECSLREEKIDNLEPKHRIEFFAQDEVIFQFDLDEILDERVNIAQINEKFEQGFDLREKAQSFKLEFQQLYPDILYPAHTIFIIREYEEIVAGEAISADIEPAFTGYAAILVSQTWAHIGNQFEFSFQLSTVASFPPRPSRPISLATAEIQVATVHNASVQHNLHQEKFENPSYWTWHRTRVNTNTMHFRFNVVLVPQNGTLNPNTATIDWLLNRSGRVWSVNYNHTCSITGRQITPPPTNWSRVPAQRQPNYRTAYENWVRANFNSNFTIPSGHQVHHIRPYFLGGTNAIDNLIHISTSHHTNIHRWFAGY